MEEILFLSISDRLELYPFHHEVIQVECATAEGLSQCTIPPWTPALVYEKLC